MGDGAWRSWWLVLAMAVGVGASTGREAQAEGKGTPKQTGWVEESKEEPAGTHYHTFRSKAVEGEVSYLIYLPPGYDDDKDRRYPVLYWLHGMTHTQREGGGLVRRLDRAIRKGRAPEMI